MRFPAFFPPIATQNVPACFILILLSQPWTEASVVRTALLDGGLGLFARIVAGIAAPGAHQRPQLCAARSWCSLETNKVQSFQSWGRLLSPPTQSPLPPCVCPPAWSLVWPNLPSEAIRLGERRNKLHEILFHTLYVCLL